MRFFYNPKKAAQAAAYVVRLCEGQVYAISLIKLLYLADRKALSLRGRPITGDEMVAMPHGPVLSRIYDEIKSEPEDGRPTSPWYEYMTERQANRVSLRIAEPPTDELSEYERGILEEVIREYGHLGPWDLRRVTHAFPEYTDPEGSSLAIDPTIILKEAGWTSEEIREVLCSNAEEIYLHKVCG